MSEKDKVLSKLKSEVAPSEGLLLGCFWNDPELYSIYDEEKLSNKSFMNKNYAFFFTLGRKMYEKGIVEFDDLSVETTIDQLELNKYYEKFGGYELIQELMEETEDSGENFDSYYNEMMKYNLVQALYNMFGEKVVEKNGKYDYRELNAEQINNYWLDKFNQIGVNISDNNVKEGDLLDITNEDIDEWDEMPDVGLPYYKSRLMTKMTTGWDFGNVYIYGAFSGKGKTALTIAKIIMSCIENGEKLLLIANEQSIKEFKKLLLITIMGNETKRPFERQRINEGNFTDDEKEYLYEAKDRIREMAKEQLKLIKFVYMENFTMDEVKKQVRRYYNRGYQRVIIDTGKPSDGGSPHEARWERFSNDFRELYKLAKPEGLNLAIWVNVQLADSAISQRFLNEFALGESKKIKNEASVLMMTRPMWDDEYDDESNELTVYKYKKDDINEDGSYYKHEFTIKKEDGKHYLMFVPKNRRGKDNQTGLDVLVLKPNFNNNTWYEVGWATVFDDKVY